MLLWKSSYMLCCYGRIAICCVVMHGRVAICCVVMEE